MRGGLFAGQGLRAATVLGALPRRHARVVSASRRLGYDVRWRVSVAAGRPDAGLPTVIAQPAIFVAGVVAYERALESGERFDALMGHSIGEYAALVAAEAMTFEDALDVVAARARAMEAAARRNPGGMAAIRGLDRVDADAIAWSAGVEVANDNSAEEIVVSGPDTALARAASAAHARGGRVLRLPVAGPFHTEAMAPASAAVERALEDVSISAPRIPVVSNVTGLPYERADDVAALLVQQVTSLVQFRRGLEWMWDAGVRGVVDLGPGEVVGRHAYATFATMERVMTVA